MISRPVLFKAMVWVLCALAWASPSWARNTKLLLPTQPLLRSQVARSALGDDIAIRFGSELPAGATVINQVLLGHGVADPRRHDGPPRSDEATCRAALINALTDLLRQVRISGGTALIGVVSNYDEIEMDDPRQYECHAGATRAVVDLKGKSAKLEGGALAQASKASAPVQAQGLKAHRKRIPEASGFAAADDANAVPLSEEGKSRYRHYLTLPSPKAFVVYETGGWRFYWKDGEAMTKTLDYCAREGKRCWLYAVDDRVVWSADPAARIATSAQLANR